MTENKICWNENFVIDEMNRFYDKHLKNQDITKHLSAFTTLLFLTDTTGQRIIDLGCGTSMLSEFCKEHEYLGADLPHVVVGCAMRNYPQYWYRSLDIITDDIAWVKDFNVVVVNGFIDVMEHPLAILEKVLKHAQKFLIIHRQEITEKGETHSHLNESYGGKTWHSIISRSDFDSLLDRMNFEVVKEIRLEFGNWENGGSSFLLRKKQTWALYEMDYKLNALFNHKRNGVFIECGANDGLRQSNTMFLERYKDWSGLLIEAVTEQFNWCRTNRSGGNTFVNCALVSDEYEHEFAEILYTPECNGLMSAMNNINVNMRMGMAGEDGVKMAVPAKTLSSILDEHGFEYVDLFVLDVEGYEMDVLRGCDFDKHHIEYLLIEELSSDRPAKEYLEKWYDEVGKLSGHDYLYKRK